ncbi:MAG: NUDIX hydrolase [Phycisphaeraceae bacterium]|nr:NUDIX hydrolase [Phycisphaeraceae bacterium]
MGKSREDNRAVMQAGAVPYRVAAAGRIEVLLITNSSGRWIVPKGGIDPGNSPADQAVLEAYEEAGVVEAEIGGEIGFYDYERGGRVHRVRLFAMLVRELARDWDEKHRREREWVALDEAIERVAFEGLKRALMGIPARKRAAA